MSESVHTERERGGEREEVKEEGWGEEGGKEEEEDFIDYQHVAEGL